MRVLLCVAVVAILAVPLLGAPSQGPRRLQLRQFPANPSHSDAEWAAILAGQTLGQEVCAGCRPGTQPQHHLAGKVAAARPKGSNLRISGGEYVDNYDIPWGVYITMDSSWICGGSVISTEFILTAGQCVSGFGSFTVLLGNTDTIFRTSYTHTAATYKGIVHEDYTEDTLLNDIGLVQLLVPVTFNIAIQPVKLPSQTDVANSFEGVNATISGFGELPSGFTVLFERYAEQQIMSNTRCARFLGSAVRPSILCGAGGVKKTGGCSKDQGDPLVTKDDDGTWKQIGIFSFLSDLGCGWGYPSAYTRVTEHLQWIQNKTSIAL